jgi:hypothetical protein
MTEMQGLNYLDAEAVATPIAPEVDHELVFDSETTVTQDVSETEMPSVPEETPRLLPSKTDPDYGEL